MSVYRTRQRSKSPSQWWVKRASKGENSLLAFFLNGGCNVMLLLHLECQHIVLLYYEFYCYYYHHHHHHHFLDFVLKKCYMDIINTYTELCNMHRSGRKELRVRLLLFLSKTWKWMSWLLAYRWPLGYPFPSAHNSCYYSIQVYKKKIAQ